MNAIEFRRAAECYGADLSRWPADLRKPASLLVRTDAEARAALLEADEIDGLLDLDRAEPALADIDQLVRRTVAETNQGVGREPSAVRMWPGAAMMLGMAMLGFVVGSLGSSSGAEAAGATDLPSYLASHGLIELFDQ